jgi:gas vesicle protein
VSIPRPRKRGKSLGLAGIGLLVGAIGGWLAGLMRAPKRRKP